MSLLTCRRSEAMAREARRLRGVLQCILTVFQFSLGKSEQSRYDTILSNMDFSEYKLRNSKSLPKSVAPPALGDR